MNPNWHGVAAAVLSVGAFLAAYRLGSRNSRPHRLAWLFILAIAALPGLAIAAYYTKRLPEMAWYYQFRSQPGSEYGMVLVGAAAGLFSTFLPRVLVAFPLFALLCVSVVPYLKPVIAPLAKEELSNQWKDDACLQSTSSTCGAASTATILRSLGAKVTEAQIAGEAHSYANGTEAWYLARSFRKRGFDASFEMSPGLDEKIRTPAIAGVRLGSIGHFIPILEIDGDRFLIADPLVGKEWISREDLLRRYLFTGFYMPVTAGKK